MVTMMPAENADAVDLLDAVYVRLEQAQSIALTLMDQLERVQGNTVLRDRLSGAASTVHLQISEAQMLTELLTQRLPTAKV